MPPSLASWISAFGLKSRRKGALHLAGWLLLAAFLVQGEAVRVHAFAHEGADFAQARETHPVEARKARTEGHDAGLCPLCREDQLFGQYLASGGIVLVAGLAPWGLVGLVPSVPFDRRDEGLRQRIRGPPRRPG